MLRRLRLPSAFALLLATCAPAGAQTVPLVRPGTTPPDGITVVAPGFATVPADSATVALYVNAPKDTISPETLAPIVNALVASGIDRKAIQTTFDITGQTKPANYAQVIVRIDHPTMQKVHDMIPLVSAAFEAHPELNVGNANVKLAHDGCEAIVDAARNDAIAGAKKRADEIAKTLGVKAGRVLAFSDSEPQLDDRGSCSNSYSIGTYGVARQTPDDLVTIRITAQVTVRYAIR